MLFLRSLLFQIVYVLNNLQWFLVAIPGFWMGRHDFFPIYGHPWARSNLWWHRVICGVTVEIRGRENIPKGGVIIAAKHQSAWETMALCAEMPDPTFILKRELLRVPMFGWYLQSAEQIAIDRSKGAEALARMMEKARIAMAQGRQLLIFPEGTRRKVDAEPAYRFGVAKLYSGLGVPCVPVALNSGLVWPKGSFWRPSGRIIMEYLEPLPPGLTEAEFFKAMQERIESATARLVQEARDGHPTRS